MFSESNICIFPINLFGNFLIKGNSEELLFTLSRSAMELICSLTYTKQPVLEGH